MAKRNRKRYSSSPDNVLSSLGISRRDVVLIRNHPNEWQNYRNVLEEKIRLAKRDRNKPVQTVYELLLTGWQECDQAAGQKR